MHSSPVHPSVSGFPLDETTSAGALASEYIYFNGKRVARRDADNTVKYYFSDNLGSASVITNSLGAMPPLEESDYYPYGGEIPITNGDPNHYKFTAKERDRESGLDVMGARYYGSALGRFVQSDPLYIEAHRLSDPQSLNLFAYARNNPTTLSDPTGLDAVLKCDSKVNCENAVQDFNNRKRAQFKVSLSKDGKLQVVKGSVEKNLSKAEGALLGAINDTKNHATINVFGNTGTSDFGDHVSSGVNGVDLGNLSKLDASSNAGGLNSGDVMAHETMDAYLSLSISDPLAADNAAGALYPGLLGPTDSYNIWNTSSTKLKGQAWNQAIVGGGTERITMNYVTPIPAIDYKFKGQSAIDKADSRVSGGQYVPPKQP